MARRRIGRKDLKIRSAFLSGLTCLALPMAAYADKSVEKASCETEQALLFEDFNDPNTRMAKLIRREKNYDIADGEMRISYIGNEKGSERIRAHIPLPRKVREATLNFDVYFPKGFDFVLGGKLFGFAPENAVWGGQTNTPDGWSSRIMWRANGRLVTYNYHQNRPGKYGEDSPSVGEGQTLPLGEWVSLSLYLNLGNQDRTGRSEVWMNGEVAGVLEGLNFHAANKNAPIEILALQTFFGGSSPRWAPKSSDGRYRIFRATVDNMGVTEGRCIRSNPIRTLAN